MRISKWMKKHTESLAGKRIAVTGSTGGLGRALCAYLAELGAELVLIDRNAARSEAHRRELQARFPACRVICIPLDMEMLSSAKRAAEQLNTMGIDVLIHNAGAYSIPRRKCESGYENVFQINFATPYYLTRLLLPTLRACGGRVVVVGSIAHRYGVIDPKDIDFSSRRSAARIYGNSKRYLMYATAALLEDEERVSLSLTHPGISQTNITAHYPKLIYAVIKYPMRLIFPRPRRASLPILSGVFTSTGSDAWIGPRLLDVWGLPRKKRLSGCRDDERRQIAAIAQQVYARCEETLNVHNNHTSGKDDRDGPETI